MSTERINVLSRLRLLNRAPFKAVQSHLPTPMTYILLRYSVSILIHIVYIYISDLFWYNQSRDNQYPINYRVLSVLSTIATTRVRH